jgi:hypothetical protein
MEDAAMKRGVVFPQIEFGNIGAIRSFREVVS